MAHTQVGEEKETGVGLQVEKGQRSTSGASALRGERGDKAESPVSVNVRT